MRIIFGLLVVLLLLVVQATEARTPCDMRSLISAQKTLLDKEGLVIRLPLGGALINPQYYLSKSQGTSGRIVSPLEIRRDQLAQVPARNKEEVLAFFDEIRGLMISVIRSGRKEKDLSPNQRLMIRRLEVLKVSLSDTYFAEGMNSHTQHLISFSPNVLKMPRLAMVALMAHELGHTLDLCNLGSSFMKRNHTVIASAPPGSPLSDLLKPTVDYALSTFARKNPALAPGLEKLLAEKAFESVDSGIAFESNPLRPIYECLSDSSPRYRKLADAHDGECSDSVFFETGAQIWAAKVVGAYLAHHPPASKLEALGLFAASMDGMNKGTTTFENDMNLIYLSDPKVQESFDCDPVAQRSCLDEFKL